MNIEFYTPSREVSESLVALVRDAILNLHKIHSEISKVEVSFHQRKKIVTTEKLCEIRYSISGHLNLVIGSADRYDKAVRKAIQKFEDAIVIHFKLHPSFAETGVTHVEL